MKLTGENRDAWYYRNIDISNRTIYFGTWQPNKFLDNELDCTWEVNDYSVQNTIKGL